MDSTPSAVSCLQLHFQARTYSGSESFLTRSHPGLVLAVASEANGLVVGLIAANTTLSACAGAVAAMVLSSYIDLRHTGIYSYDVVATMNGCLTGLVA